MLVYLDRYSYRLPTSSNSVVVGRIGAYIIYQTHIPDTVAYPIIVLVAPAGFLNFRKLEGGCSCLNEFPFLNEPMRNFPYPKH